MPTLRVLLLLSAAALASCQLDPDSAVSEGAGGGSSDSDSPRPAVGTFFPMRIRKIRAQKLTVPFTPGIKVTFRCSVSSGVFHAWVRNLRVAGNTPEMEVTMNDRDVYGVYTCVAKQGAEYFGMDFVLTELPSNDTTVTQLAVRTNHNPTLRCLAVSSTERYKWYRYNDELFVYQPIAGATGKELSLQYSRLVDRDRGFTYYKCEPDVSGPRAGSAEIYKLVKEPNEELIDGKLTKVYAGRVRQIPSDVGSIPLAVTPNSKVTFECQKVTPADSARWYFRPNTTDRLSDYTEVGGSSVNVAQGPRSSVLSVNNCDVRNKGYYRCNVGGVIRYAFLDIQVIVPTIHEYSKRVYDMSTLPGDDNELECEIPLGGEVRDVVWRLVPASGPSIDIRVNQVAAGFTTSVKDTGVNRLATITFKDSATLNGARLECRLGDELDYVMLRAQRKIEVTVGDSEYPNYKYIGCNHPNLTDVKFHINNRRDDPVAEPLASHGSSNSTHNNYYYNVVSADQKWFRCSGVNAAGVRMYADPKPLMENPLSLGITVDGSVLDPRVPKAKVAGQKVEFVCNFTNWRGANIQAADVKLEFNGRVKALIPESIGDGKYKFVYDSPTPSDSGTYKCRHEAADLLKKVTSPTVTINFCTTDQFMCDGGCRDKGIMCDGKEDCADRTDELPALCAECEPNEVPCGLSGGKAPTRKCVLKHWLCDGQDDCENRYDEDSDVAKRWCINNCLKPSVSCPRNSTCCAISDKCILRAYECDKETDCLPNTDETGCCRLTLNDPTRAQRREFREGSDVRLTCTASGYERPTINWRCNWGHLRDPERMTETNRVVRKKDDGTFEVEGTLVIRNFRREDECIYNCEAITKCKRQLSPEFDVKVA